VTVVADVILLGNAHGLERPGQLVGGVLALLLGFVMFSYATRTIPAGLANALWAGSSIVLVLLLGRIFLDETISAPHYVCLGLILAGARGRLPLGQRPRGIASVAARTWTVPTAAELAPIARRVDQASHATCVRARTIQPLNRPALDFPAPAQYGRHSDDLQSARHRGGPDDARRWPSGLPA
jgi:multidrug transporter EmrE-like cation transporter